MKKLGSAVDEYLDSVTDEQYPNAVMYSGEDVMSMGYGILPKMVMKDERLSREAKLVYSHISCYAGAGPSSYPSRELIAKETKIPYKSLGKYIKELRAYGYITTQARRNSRNQFTSCLYIINRAPVIDEQLLREHEEGLLREAARRKKYREKVDGDPSQAAEDRSGSAPQVPRSMVENPSISNGENRENVEKAIHNENSDLQNPRSFPMPSRTVTGPDAVQDGNGPMPSRTVTDNIVINNTSLYNQQSINPKDNLTSKTREPESVPGTAGGATPPDRQIDEKGPTGESEEAQTYASRGILADFDRLCAMSIKPVREESRMSAWRAYCAAIEEGRTPQEVLSAYRHYRSRYFAENRSVKFAMQLRDWLAKGSGLLTDIEMMAAEGRASCEEESYYESRGEMLMRASDEELSGALKAVDERYASIFADLQRAEGEGDLAERSRLIDLQWLYFTAHRRQAQNAWLKERNERKAV